MSGGRPTGWEGADKWFAGGADDAAATHPTDDEPAAPAELRCDVCGAVLEADQTYCLECGSPTPLAPRLRRGGRNLAVLAGAVAILGLGAGALAYAVVADDGGDTTTPTVLTTATGSLVPLPPETAATTGPLPPDTSFTTPTVPDFTAPTDPIVPTTGFDTVTGPPGTAPTAPSFPTPTSPTTSTLEDPGTTISSPDPTTVPGVGASDSDWPAGATAWTAILSSVRSEADARAAKTRIAVGGEPAGVFPSSDFADLRPGYWVVFSGRYSGRADAIAQATRLRSDFPGAYARRLSG